MTARTAAFALLALALAFVARADAPAAQYTLQNGSTTFATVQDRRTGLEWKRDFDCSNAGASACAFGGALAACATLNANTFAGHTDWRLASAKELQSIVDRRSVSVYQHPSVDPVFPMPSGTTTGSGLPIIPFWTSTPQAGETTKAWYVDFAFGTVLTQSFSFSGYARCVRGAGLH